jgi:hypothetical protein
MPKWVKMLRFDVERWPLGIAMLLASTLIFGGCGTAKLSNRGRRVEMLFDTTPEQCRAIGTVVGSSGGAYGGYVANSDLVEYAMNDLRNKAAELGATHVRASPPQFGAQGGTTTGATVVGNAYQCVLDREAESPRSGLPESSSPIQQTNGLSEEQILEVLRSHKDEVRGCLEREPLEAAEPEMKVSLTIQNDGSTSRIQVAPEELRSLPLGQCIITAVSAWTFPAFSGPPQPIDFPVRRSTVNAPP